MKRLIGLITVFLIFTVLISTYYISANSQKEEPIVEQQQSSNKPVVTPKVNTPKVTTPVKKENFTGLYLTQKEMPIYDAVTNEVIGSLRKGVRLHLNKNPNGDYYTTPFENSIGLVKSDHVKLLEKRKEIKQPVSKKSIYLSNDEFFYIGKDLKTPVFKGKKHRRYPVLSENQQVYQTQIGGVNVYISKKKAKVDKGIPVLMYHHILRDAENKKYRNASTTITDFKFKSQMNVLKEMNYRTITPDDLDKYLDGKINLPVNSILITFDDGLKSNLLYAYPALKENGFKATNFIISNRVKDKPTPFNPDSLQFLSKPELKEMEGVFNYEGHTYGMHNVQVINGKNIPDLLSKSYAQIEQDFIDAKKTLPQSHFAYPFGAYDKKALDILKKHNYKTAYTTKEGYVKRGDTKLELKRLGVYPDTTIEKFKKIVSY